MRVLLVAVVVSHRLDVCFVEASKEQHVPSVRRESAVSAAPLKFKVELSPQSMSACRVSSGSFQVSRANPKLSHTGKAHAYCTIPYLPYRCAR